MATYVTGRMVQEQSIDTNDLTQQAAIPPGAVMSFAMSAAPVGWLPCDGAAISRTTYASLFAAVRTIHGAGDGSNTFNVPDLRGEFIRGWDNGRAVDTGRTFGSSQGSLIINHTHSGTTGDDSPDHTHNYILWNQLHKGSGLAGGTYWEGQRAVASGGANQRHQHGFTTGNPNGGLGGSETRPRNVALLYCIKF